MTHWGRLGRQGEGTGLEGSTVWCICGWRSGWDRQGRGVGGQLVEGGVLSATPIRSQEQPMETRP